MPPPDDDVALEVLRPKKGRTSSNDSKGKGSCDSPNGYIPPKFIDEEQENEIIQMLQREQR